MSCNFKKVKFQSGQDEEESEENEEKSEEADGKEDGDENEVFFIKFKKPILKQDLKK